jgi:hypothetical protein
MQSKEVHFLNGGSLLCNVANSNLIASYDSHTLFRDNRSLYYLGNKNHAILLSSCTTLEKTQIQKESEVIVNNEQEKNNDNEN